MTSLLSLLGPSVDSETHEIVGTPDYRIVDNLRYRYDGESMEDYQAFVDSITVLRIVRKKGESEADQCKRAFQKMHDWWKIGSTWD
jgi:hypothetical protein